MLAIALKGYRISTPVFGQLKINANYVGVICNRPQFWDMRTTVLFWDWGHLWGHLAFYIFLFTYKSYRYEYLQMPADPPILVLVSPSNTKQPLTA